MAPIPGVSLLNRVTQRVWEAAQITTSRKDYELHSITLRFLGQLAQWSRGGVTRHELLGDLGSTPSLDTASREAFGIPFHEFGIRARERDERRERELWDCIPDFDPLLKISPKGGRIY